MLQWATTTCRCSRNGLRSAVSMRPPASGLHVCWLIAFISPVVRCLCLDTSDTYVFPAKLDKWSFWVNKSMMNRKPDSQGSLQVPFTRLRRLTLNRGGVGEWLATRRWQRQLFQGMMESRGRQSGWAVARQRIEGRGLCVGLCYSARQRFNLFKKNQKISNSIQTCFDLNRTFPS
jgi:hypothetical protein